MSDLHGKSESEETKGQQRAIGYLVAAIVLGIIVAFFLVAGGGR